MPRQKENKNLRRQKLNNKLLQHKLNAEAASVLHQKCIANLQQLSLLVEFVAISVPILIIISKFLTKSTKIFWLIETVSELLAGVLLILVVLKLVYGWSRKKTRHSVMLRMNNNISHEIDELLEKSNRSESENIQFLRRIKEIDNEDNELFINAKKSETQKAYREALKKIEGSLATCHVCNTSIWKYKKKKAKSNEPCSACGI